MGWNFFSLNVFSILVPQHNSVPGNVTVFFNQNDGMLLRIMGVRSTSSFSYLDIVLSWVITLYLFCHNDGCSKLGFYPVEVMHSFKYIRT